MNNKNIYSVLIIVLILVLLASCLSFTLLTISKETNTYNIEKRLWQFKHNGGLPLQISASMLSYLGITLTSIFDKDIRNDMNAINWNIFNPEESPTLKAQKVSFYKGVPVFKFNYNRSGSFLAIFISREQESPNTLRHEFGHNIQQLILGPINYLLCIGLPSWQEWSNRYYYDRPWEITADLFGGVSPRKYNNTDIQRGYSFLDISAMFGTFSYYFLPGECEL